MADQPLVDAIGQQQNFNALLAEDLQMRTILGRLKSLGRDVVDLVLPRLHARDVLSQRHFLLRAIGMGCRKTQQLGDTRLIGVIFANALFQQLTELVPEFFIILCVVLGHLFEQAEYALGAARADLLDILAFLQDLARDVERQIGHIDHAAHEAQIHRQQLLGIVHDEHALDVQLDAMARVAIPQIERRLSRHVEQLGVLVTALDAGMHPGQWLLIVMRHVLIEGLVFLVRDVVLRACPERVGLVDGFIFTGRLHGLGFFVPGLLGHANRQCDMVGVLAQNLADLPAVEQVLLLRTQMQNHFGAAPRMFNVGDGVIALTARNPFDTGRGRRTGFTAAHRDFVGDDERGIEADAELADQIRVFLLVTGQRREEFLGTRFGDGAQVRDRLIFGHADAVIGDGNRLGRRIDLHTDPELRVVFEEAGVGQRFVAQFVASIRGIGDQLAQEDFLIRIQRVDHQLQQLFDFGLEGLGFGHGRHNDCRSLNLNG